MAVSEKIRAKIKDVYINDASEPGLRQLSDKYKIPLRTLARWSRSENWQHLREIARQQSKQDAKKKVIENVIKNDNENDNSVAKNLQQSNENVPAVQSKSDIDYTPRSQLEALRIQAKSASIISSVKLMKYCNEMIEKGGIDVLTKEGIIITRPLEARDLKDISYTQRIAAEIIENACNELVPGSEIEEEIEIKKL